MNYMNYPLSEVDIRHHFYQVNSTYTYLCFVLILKLNCILKDFSILNVDLKTMILAEYLSL